MADQPPSQDFVTEIDYTAQELSGSLLNAGFADLSGNTAGDGLSGVVPAIWTQDTALGVPNVPNPGLVAKWVNYIWYRIPYSTNTTGPAIIYTWNATAISNATYLKWISTAFDPTSILASITTLTTSVATANNAANTANTNASNALTQALAAVQLANTANNGIAAATATANSASALVTGANANATNAIGIAQNALTVATTANNGLAAANAAAAAAQATANKALAVGHDISYTAPGNYQWICPAGVTSLTVTCVGGGGGGGGGGYGGTFGCGGGGEFAQSVLAVVPGTTYNFVVGSQGIGQTNMPTSGTASSFGGNLVIANPGLFGNNTPNQAGTGGTGQILFDGGPPLQNGNGTGGDSAVGNGAKEGIAQAGIGGGGAQGPVPYAGGLGMVRLQY
jgi:hypothetical protein